MKTIVVLLYLLICVHVECAPRENNSWGFVFHVVGTPTRFVRFNGASSVLSSFSALPRQTDTFTVSLANNTRNAFTVEAWVRPLISYENYPITRKQNALYIGDGTANNYIIVNPAEGNMGPDTIGAVHIRINGGAIQINNFDVTGALQYIHVAISFRASGSGASSAKISQTLVDGQIRTDTFNFNVANPNIFNQIIVGLLPAAVQTPFTTNGAYAGDLGRLVIWDDYTTAVQDAQNRILELQGNEPGLLHVYEFDNISLSNIVYDKGPGNINGVFATTAPLSTVDSPLESADISSSIYYPQFPVSRWSRVGTTYTEHQFLVRSNVAVTSTVKPAFAVQSTLYGSICNISLPGCTAFNQGLQNYSMIAGPLMHTFQYKYVPTRRLACGKVDTVRVFAYDPTRSDGDSNILITYITVYPHPGMNVPQFTEHLYTPTSGGIIQISGTFLGAEGPFGSDEYVVLSIPGYGNSTCLNASVSGNTISCRTPAGLGNGGSIYLKLCTNLTYFFSNVFSYSAPVVNPPSGVSFTVLNFTGLNFGPPRSFDGIRDYVKINNSFCNITENTHTSFVCTLADSLVNEARYSGEISIGGQLRNFSFEFQICNPRCENGGKCVSKDVCDCSSTSYTGAYCNDSLTCFPPCGENGRCINKTDNTGTACLCNEGWAGDSCNLDLNAQSSDNNTPLVVGVVVGVGGFIIIVVVVAVLIFLLKREKREGTNFVPLEKKDFTKIIYGEQLSQAPDKTNLKELEKLLVEDASLASAFAISGVTQITEADKIAKALVIVFQDNDKVLELLKAFISEEVRTTESAGTLFRANSMVSKMFKFYSRLIGLPYVYVTIGPEIGKLIEENLGLEVDPEKMEEGRDLDEMRWALMSQSQKILKQILISDEKCPAQFRQLFSHIAKCVAERFPDNVNTTIGGFIFLRLFCPAVSSPEAYGIVEEPPSADSRRLLILITKVLQNLSNDVEFGSKEPYMTKMNDFIHSNRQKLANFYERLLKPPTKPPVTCDLPKNIKQLNLSVLASHIKDNLEKIEDSQIKANLSKTLTE